MALAIASGTESDVIQKNNHNDTMINPDTISGHVASTQVQRTQQYLSMAITMTNSKCSICRCQLCYKQKDNISALDSLEAGNFCD